MKYPEEIRPIGIIPQDVWLATMRLQRIYALMEAMKRFSEASRVIPKEWILELENLVLDNQIIPLKNIC